MPAPDDFEGQILESWARPRIFITVNCKMSPLSRVGISEKVELLEVLTEYSNEPVHEV